MKNPIFPGSTIAIFGGGQLGRMSAMAAKRMGYRVHVFDPDPDAPACQIAHAKWNRSFMDMDAVTAFAQSADVATFEWESIPLQAIHLAEKHVPVHPNASALDIIQNRWSEKSYVNNIGVETVPLAHAQSLDEFHNAVKQIGYPCVAKTVHGGYDGKGQVRIETDSPLQTIWEELGEKDVVVERWIELASEFSVIIARGTDGCAELYGPIFNQHINHILHLSVCPYPLDETIVRRAKEMITAVAESMNYIGVLCIEFFLSKDGNLYFNEMAPRPHNSGHLTIEAHRTSQFEQHIRSICGLPLGCGRQLQPAAMVNLLGGLWLDHSPDWIPVLKDPDAFLHLYGKTQPKPGRKMGHVTVLNNSAEAAKTKALHLYNSITKTE